MQMKLNNNKVNNDNGTTDGELSICNESPQDTITVHDAAFDAFKIFFSRQLWFWLSECCLLQYSNLTAVA